MSGGVNLESRLAAFFDREIADTPRATDLARFVLRYGSLQTLRSGRFFAWQGDRLDRCALVLSGRIMPVKNRIGGGPVTLPSVNPGSWLCLAETALNACAQADYRADGETELFAIPSFNLSLLEKNPDFVTLLNRLLARELLSLHGWLLEGSPRERIIGWLLSRRRVIAGTENRAVAATQASIACDLSLTRETVNKHLALLEAEGLLTTARAEILIPDWSALEQTLRED